MASSSNIGSFSINSRCLSFGSDIKYTTPWLIFDSRFYCLSRFKLFLFYYWAPLEYFSFYTLSCFCIFWKKEFLFFLLFWSFWISKLLFSCFLNTFSVLLTSLVLSLPLSVFLIFGWMLGFFNCSETFILFL